MLFLSATAFFFSSKKSLSNTIRVSDGVDPDQDEPLFYQS